MLRHLAKAADKVRDAQDALDAAIGQREAIARRLREAESAEHYAHEALNQAASELQMFVRDSFRDGTTFVSRRSSFSEQLQHSEQLRAMAAQEREPK